MTIRAKDNLFWASRERRPPATDYLEVDLGRARIINLIEFDISRKPLTVDVQYDRLGDPPKRSFAPVEPWNDYPFSPTITYDANELPWVHVLIFFRGSHQSNITTQYVRLGFTRRVPNSVVEATTPLFDPQSRTPIAFSIDVKNLKIGRYAQPDGTPVS